MKNGILWGQKNMPLNWSSNVTCIWSWWFLQEQAEAVFAVVGPALMERPHSGVEGTSGLGSGWACAEIPALPPVSCCCSTVTESLWTWVLPCLGGGGRGRGGAGHTGLPKRKITREGKVTLLGFHKGVHQERKHPSIILDIHLPQVYPVSPSSLEFWGVGENSKTTGKMLQIEDAVWIGCDEDSRLPLW